MSQNTDYMQDDFYEYMNNRLRYRGITLKDMCEGIIDTDKLYKYMRQQLSLSKLVRDRLLDRMGGSDYDYEYYLLPGEYELWEKRQKLVRSVLVGEECKKLTDKSVDIKDIYNVDDETDGRLSRQFALAMKAQSMKVQAIGVQSMTIQGMGEKDGKSQSAEPQSGELHTEKRSSMGVPHSALYQNEEYHSILTEAVKQTVPDFDRMVADIECNISDGIITDMINEEKGMSGNIQVSEKLTRLYCTTKRLGCQEIALILDIALCIAGKSITAQKEDNHGIILAMKIVLSFLKYIPDEFNEQAAVVSIYPKAVCSLCKIYEIYGININERIFLDGNSFLIELCDRAIEMLGIGMRTYYIWELLDYRERCTGKKDELKSAIGYAYNLVNLDVRTTNDAYLYIETEVFDAAKVVDVRRCMMGMTKKDLCRDLCTEMTLLNFINKKRNPHLHTVRMLFDRLNMGRQLIRAQIASASYEDRMNVREIKKLSARGEYEKAYMLNENLRDKLDMEFIENVRVVEGNDIFLRLKKNCIDMEQYGIEYNELLKNTTGTLLLEDGEDIFITGDELICLYNVIRYGNEKEKLDLLYNICLSYEKNFIVEKKDDTSIYYLNHVNRNALIMNYLANSYGNMNDFIKSDSISNMLIRQMLTMRRMNYVPENMYNLWWNYGERYGYDEKKDMEEKLNKCIKLVRWQRKHNLEAIYCKEYGKYYV